MSTNNIVIFRDNYDQEVEEIITFWATAYEMDMLYDEFEELNSYDLINGHDSEKNFCPDCRKHAQLCRCWAHEMANDNPRCGCCGLPLETCDCNPLWRKIEENRMEAALQYMELDEEDLEDTPF